VSGERRTLITCVDIDTGESDSIEIGPGEFMVVCGGDRYVTTDQAHANGTNVVTVKRHGLT